MIKESFERWSFVNQSICKCKRSTDIHWCNACIEAIKINNYSKEKTKEQEMTTHKFKVENKVRYNEFYASGMQAYGDMVINEIHSTGYYATSKLLNRTDVWLIDKEIELVEEPEMTKQLIDSKNYKDLKEGDEVEVTIRGKINTSNVSGIGLIGSDNNYHASIHADYASLDFYVIQSINKILPKATKLEVGELLTQYNCVSTGWKVLHINKRSVRKNLTLLNIDNDISFLTGSGLNYSDHTTFERKSGIPIDWDATFS